MACYSPLRGYKSIKKNPSTGKRKIVFRPQEGFIDQPINIPCGQCIGCRLEYSRQWAVRCVHEAQQHKKNCFITLTYSPENLPENGSLVKKHFQDFMKRLRKRFGEGIRYFHCGEYGELNSRPHYHACLFNFDFDDKYLFKIKQGNPLYRSSALEQLWPYGNSSIGEVTFQSAAYVARYVLKKHKGPDSDKHYQRVNLDTGEVVTLQKEYTTMSRRPGIAKEWFLQYKTDVYPSDYVVINGKKYRPPKYYDNLFEVDDPIQYEELKMERIAKAKQHSDNNTTERLRVREKVKQLVARLLKREIEQNVTT